MKNKEGNLTIIPSHSSEVEIEEGYQLVYLGKKIQREEEVEENYDETIDDSETEREIKAKNEQESN